MNKKNRVLYFEHQHGGMLMELMLSVALAAILIPFLVRYQSNTIERARNIAVVRQMESVRNALERCIFENRGLLTDVVGTNRIFSEDDADFIECVVLRQTGFSQRVRGLINYGLTDEFVDDVGDNYRIRILKTEDNTGEPVLQGVVLLTNRDINALRTREIVKLGGDKIGFLDGDNIQGGFNTFRTEKHNLGLANINSGIVETTDTMRGNSKYLWRLPSGSELDATMLSFLNLDGHDIVNVEKISSGEARFNSSLTLTGDIVSEINNLQFKFTPEISSSSWIATQANVWGNLDVTSDDSLTMEVGNKLDCTHCNFNDVVITKELEAKSDVELENFSISLKSANSSLVANDLNIKKIDTNIIKTDSFVLTTQLEIAPESGTPMIMNRGYYWDLSNNAVASLKEVVLINNPKLEDSPNLTEFVNTYIERERRNFGTGGAGAGKFGMYSDQISLGADDRGGVAEYLRRLQFIRRIVTAKYKCVQMYTIKTDRFDNCLECVRRYGERTDSAADFEYCMNVCISEQNVTKCMDDIK